MIISKYKSTCVRILKSYLFILVVFSCQSQDQYSGYLFTYFTGNHGDEEAVRYALSDDGYNYYALNENQPVLDSKQISATGGVRDPHILRGTNDDSFYMVLTDMVSDNGWNSNRAMVLLKSKDLIHWSHSVINIPETYPETFGDVVRVWAPQTIYDPGTKKYMIYWSMLGSSGPDIIYYAYANKDFTALETTPKQLFFSPTNSACIDGDIVYKNGKYHLFFKNESQGGGIRKAISDQLTEGYIQQPGFYDQTDDAVEGSGIFKLIDSEKYILMYDMYMRGKYQFTVSDDLQNFKIVDQQISMNFHPRHGTVIPITETEKNALLKQWGKSDKGTIIGVEAKDIKPNNVIIDSDLKQIEIPITPNANPAQIDLNFKLVPWAKQITTGVQDFSKGPVDFHFNIADLDVTYKVHLKSYNNPVLVGYYADPEILYSNKTNRFYLYPTSDGFDGWSGTFFKTFSSEDLVHWKDEGVILDLKKQVPWANRNAWAPAAAEKLIDNEYRYFYYFTAAQKIGVATSKNPYGPFEAMDTPLIGNKPNGVSWGQEIDPDVFTDPKTGQSYLYWGNGYLGAVELEDNMTSIKENTFKNLTPDATFREGTEVFYRQGKYYFLWSEDDTRSPNYRVRYAISNSPMGPLEIPKNNLILEKIPSEGIYGTGHNSVIQVPKTDHWYIVYHRFNRPHGITMGDAAGFHREVCIDKLEFDNKGYIIPTTPTLNGITTLNK